MFGVIESVGGGKSSGNFPIKNPVCLPHSVQFYEEESFLLAQVAGLFDSALRAGQPVVGILRSTRIGPLTALMEQNGIDVARLMLEGRMALLDADLTLQKFMVANLPDRTLFREAIGGTLSEMYRRFGRVYAYGEMVDLLWARKNTEGTLALEHEWNEMGKEIPFSLMCGYSMSQFDGVSEAVAFERVCSLHSDAFPTEIVDWENDRQKSQVIAALEQKARSLESEVANRRQAEERLARHLEDLGRINESLRREQERLSAIVNQSVAGIVQTDTAGKFVLVNDRFCEIVGRSREELMGLTFQEITFSDDAKANEVHFRRLLTERVPYLIEQRYVHPNGRLVWVSNSVSLLNDAAGAPVGVVAVVVDSTERKKAEEELKKHADEMARSNADLARFAHVASHDLKEPIRNVRLYVELLERNSRAVLDEKSLLYMNFISEGAGRMGSLVDDLLAYSSVDNGSFDDLAPVDCNELIDSLKITICRIIEENSATLVYEGLPIVQAKRSLLMQVFQNLICNAIKFRRNEAPVVRISADRRGTEYVFSVSDNGIGFKQEFDERIFVLFQRLHHRRAYPGTGLGLAICKKIVERHGGTIWAKSEVDKGSTFHFTLPARDKD